MFKFLLLLQSIEEKSAKMYLPLIVHYKTVTNFLISDHHLCVNLFNILGSPILVELSIVILSFFSAVKFLGILPHFHHSGVSFGSFFYSYIKLRGYLADFVMRIM